MGQFVLSEKALACKAICCKRARTEMACVGGRSELRFEILAVLRRHSEIVVLAKKSAKIVLICL
jgi:hypothetical protein